LEVLEVEICCVLLFDKLSGTLIIAESRGLSKDVLTKTMIIPGEDISGRVFASKEPLLIENIEDDQMFQKSEQEKYYRGSFISVPLVNKNRAIGVINICNKKNKKPLSLDDLRLIKGIASNAAIAIENAQLYVSLQDTYIRTVLALTSAIDARDHYTKSHSENVTRYAVAIAREMALPEDEVEKIRWACELHDVGKIGIQDSILTKPSKLDPNEWEAMKQHSLKGAEILKSLDFLDGSIHQIEQHHERFDGKGYPYGLKGQNILLGARIIGVADAFDAMTTNRPYSRALSLEEAVEELKRNKGTQFDPAIVDFFLKAIEKNPGLIKF
jgi:putative nucleotidyltransferase with HDIG domain